MSGPASADDLIEQLGDAGADLRELARLARTSRSAFADALRSHGITKLGHRVLLENRLVMWSEAQLVHHEQPARAQQPPAHGFSRTKSPSDTGTQTVPVVASADEEVVAQAITDLVAPLQAIASFQVVSAFVNVRERQSTASAVLAQYDEGQTFEVCRIDDNWVQPCSVLGSGRRGWVMVDGAELGLGRLVRQLFTDEEIPHSRSTSARPSALQQRLPLLLRAKAVSGDGPLPHGTTGPVQRFRVLRPLTLVHATPSRESAVCAVALMGDLVWSCKIATATVVEPFSSREWLRLADPDGWVAALCPAGLPQLEVVVPALSPEREMEALDLWMQVRVAVLGTYGLAGRASLGEKFRGWESEALALDQLATTQSQQWEEVVRRRQLAQKSAFAQCLLSVCHRDVVLEAQSQAVRRALKPSQCKGIRRDGELGLSLSHVVQLLREQIVIVDRVLSSEMVQGCRLEAEELDANGYLQPPAMHRALGDRRDRLMGLEEESPLLRPQGCLVRLITYLKSLAADIITGGYDEGLTVPPSIMLACYDGQGAFYKPHMDSMDGDPRRVTAIMYLVDEEWDGRQEADGGNLVYWKVGEEHSAFSTGHGNDRREIEPKSGRLVVFNARTIMHEVLPTHRKRFAVTLWFFREDLT